MMQQNTARCVEPLHRLHEMLNNNEFVIFYSLVQGEMISHGVSLRNIAVSSKCAPRKTMWKLLA